MQRFILNNFVPLGLPLLNITLLRVTGMISVFIYAGILLFLWEGMLYIQSIGSGLGIWDQLEVMVNALPLLIHKKSLSTSSSKKSTEIKWKNHSIVLKNKILLNKNVISKHVSEFWKDQIETLPDIKNNHIIILFRVKSEDGLFLTLGQLQRINPNEMAYLIDYLTNILTLKSNSYTSIPIMEIIFSFGIRKGNVEPKQRFIEQNTFQRFSGYKLPVTMDPLKYGKLIRHTGTEYIVQVNPKNMVIINQTYTDSLLINKVQFLSSGDLILEYTDTATDQITFERVIGKNKFIFTDGVLTLSTTIKKYKKITALDKAKEPNTKMLTADIETRIIGGKQTPFCISFYNGGVATSFYLTDFPSPKEMMKTAIKSILVKEYNKHHVYIHNFGGFDGIFLFNVLTELGSVTPIFREGRLLMVKISFRDGGKNYTLIFNDSLLLLLTSLGKLGKSFNLDQGKTLFPYDFVNKMDNLNYVGEVPGFHYFNGISYDEYVEYSNQFINKPWSLRDETIKYCENDCIVLFEVISEFSNIIFSLFRINIHTHPTLPSLAFAIFRSNFLPKLIEEGAPVNIPQLTGQIQNDIRLGYTGGTVDVYNPVAGPGAKYYDFNSLYPSVMAKYDMPVGTCTYFKGDIRKINPDAFGFFFCKVTAPTSGPYVNFPILQTHVKSKDGVRTIAGLGVYHDMLFSMEMDNAKKFGYQFEILWGYTFEKANLFEGIIGFLYQMRLAYPKSNPMNLVAKITMNSLYGRFGMKDGFSEFFIVDKDKYQEFETEIAESLVSFEELDNKFLVELKSKDTLRNTMLSSGSEKASGDDLNTNIAIASAITAYARMEMANLLKYLVDNDYTIFYKDTDSVVIDRELPDSMVSSSELGKLKLEFTLNKGIFLAPKVYCLETDEGQLVVKVKGLGKEVELTVADFESLLYKDAKLERSQEKWFRSISDSSITIKDQLYTLTVTDNKRELVFDSKGLFVTTKPYLISTDINNNKILTPPSFGQKGVRQVR